MNLLVSQGQETIYTKIHALWPYKFDFLFDKVYI